MPHKAAAQATQLELRRDRDVWRTSASGAATRALRGVPGNIANSLASSRTFKLWLGSLELSAPLVLRLLLFFFFGGRQLGLASRPTGNAERTVVDKAHKPLAERAEGGAPGSSAGHRGPFGTRGWLWSRWGSDAESGAEDEARRARLPTWEPQRRGTRTARIRRDAHPRSSLTRRAAGGRAFCTARTGLLARARAAHDGPCERTLGASA